MPPPAVNICGAEHMRNRICIHPNPVLMWSHPVLDSQPTTSRPPAAGERHLAEKLRLERLPSDRPLEAVCFLCDEYFEPGGAVAILYEGEMPMGYVCCDCASAPHHAAEKVRRRVRRIESLLQSKVDDSSAEHHLKSLALIHRRAVYWKALAKRIEKLTSWE
jgi:hypothetical protein